MADPHRERRTRWIEEGELAEFDGETWISESRFHALMDRELVCERRRCAELYCSYCKDSKPFRDRETNTFMHQIYTDESSAVRTVKIVECYSDAIWRNEDQ